MLLLLLFWSRLPRLSGLVVPGASYGRVEEGGEVSRPSRPVLRRRRRRPGRSSRAKGGPDGSIETSAS